MDELMEDIKKLANEDEIPQGPVSEEGEENEERGDEEDDVGEEEEDQEPEDREFSFKKLLKLPVEVASVGVDSLKDLAHKVKANMGKREEVDILPEDSVTLKELLDSAPSEIKKELVTKMAELGTLFYFTSRKNQQITKGNPQFASLLEALDQMIEVEEEETSVKENDKDEVE